MTISFAVAPVSAWCASGHTFDHVLTDPPYPDHVQRDGLMLHGNRNLSRVEVVRAAFDPLTSLDFVKPLVAGVKRWALFHCALESLGDYRREAPDRFIRSCIYEKDRAMPQLTGDRPGSKCEGMALFHSKSAKRWAHKGTHNVFYAMPEHRAKLRHPTGKPLMLCMAVVEAFTEPGEWILDPFCGAGSYGLACAALNRNYVGSDSDPIHVATASEKLAGFDPSKALAAYEKYCDRERWIREPPAEDWIP